MRPRSALRALALTVTTAAPVAAAGLGVTAGSAAAADHPPVYHGDVMYLAASAPGSASDAI